MKVKRLQHYGGNEWLLFHELHCVQCADDLFAHREHDRSLSRTGLVVTTCYFFRLRRTAATTAQTDDFKYPKYLSKNAVAASFMWRDVKCH